MTGMKVNFNGVRKSAMFAYDRLTAKLNASIITESQMARANGCEWDINIKGYVLIDADDIQKDMESLRSMIGAIAMTYEPDNEDFQDVYEQEYPEDKSMLYFNPEADD